MPKCKYCGVVQATAEMRRQTVFAKEVDGVHWQQYRWRCRDRQACALRVEKNRAAS